MTRGTTELDMLEKKADVNNIRTVVATSNYKTSFIIGKNGEEVNEVIDDKYLVKEANEHFAEVFYGHLWLIILMVKMALVLRFIRHSRIILRQ